MKKLFVIIQITTIIFVIGCDSTTSINDPDNNSSINLQIVSKNLPDDIRSMVPDSSIEDISQRSKYGKNFLNVDGTFTAIIKTVPIHFKDENGLWQDIETIKRFGKISGSPYDVMTEGKANPEYHISRDYYSERCVDQKVGVTLTAGVDTTMSRYLPEWDLSSVDTPVASISSVTIYFLPDRAVSGQTILSSGSIGDQPTDGSTSDETNYANAIWDEIGWISVGTTGTKSYSVTDSDEKTLLKNHCNGSGWYAVGYKFQNENMSNYILVTNHTLEFTYSGP